MRHTFSVRKCCFHGFRHGLEVNNIEPLTPEGWFKEGCEMNEGEENGNGIWMNSHSKGNFYGRPPLE